MTLIDDLVDKVLETGQTPEEVCRDCPDALPEVRARVEKLLDEDAKLGELFPFPDSTEFRDTSVPSTYEQSEQSTDRFPIPAPSVRRHQPILIDEPDFRHRRHDDELSMGVRHRYRVVVVVEPHQFRENSVFTVLNALGEPEQKTSSHNQLSLFDF